MDKICWGVLSTADIGLHTVIPAIQQATNCTVVSIASRDAARAEAAAVELGIPGIHDSYESLLEDDGVDAVYIPLPNHLHPQWTIAAARAGKHVLCEKPLALDAESARQMVDVCATVGVKFMEAFMYRFHPAWVTVRRLIDAGRIGRLRAVHSWFSYFNDDENDIRNSVATGGGALLDVGCYSVNLSRMLFASEPVTVSAMIERDPSFGTDVVTTGLLEFAGGAATFTCATQLEPDQRVQISGTHGRIEIEIPFNPPPHLETRVLVTSGGDPPAAPSTEILVIPPANQYTIQAELFADAVLNDTPVPTPPEDGVANMRVIERLFGAAGPRARVERSGSDN